MLLKAVPSRDRLVEDHADIFDWWWDGSRRLTLRKIRRGMLVPKIAASIVWKRCPKSPNLIDEVAAFGVLALFVAADRYDHGSKATFDTYAGYWVDKYCRLYLNEIIGSVPRTGHMGVEEEGINAEGERWVVYKPRRSVMDLFDAALARIRQYRGRAAGGMAVFDAQLMLPGSNPDDEQIDVFSTEGPTREYLQRRVGVGGARFPWTELDKPVSDEVIAPWDKPNPLDDVEFTRGKREFSRTWRRSEPHCRRRCLPRFAISPSNAQTDSSTVGKRFEQQRRRHASRSTERRLGGRAEVYIADAATQHQA